MERVEAEGETVVWHPAARLAVVSFAPDAQPTEVAARVVLAALDRWAGDPPRPFRVLVDAAGLRDATPGYRTLFGDYFRARGQLVRLALFNANPFVRVMAAMFALATRADIRAFRSEADARAWLAALEERDRLVARP